MFKKKNVGGEHFSSTEGEKLPLIYQSINSTAVTLTKKPSRDDSFASVQISVKQALQDPWTPAVVVFITMRGDVVVTQFPGVVLDASVAVHIEKAKEVLREFWAENSQGKYLALTDEDDVLDSIWFVRNYNSEFEDAYAAARYEWDHSDEEFFHFMKESLALHGYIVESVPFEEYLS